MIDLSTNYLGLTLKTPLVASASPLSMELDNLRRMEESNISAVVLESLFEEQIELESYELDRFLSDGAESFAESLTYFPDMTQYNIGPDGYLEYIQKAKQAVDIPIIGSLNGVSAGGWVRYAKLIEEAGADALELNIYHLPTDPETTAATIEQMYCDLVRKVKTGLQIPAAVKLGPYFSSIPNMGRQLDEAGADALVLFNRLYQPDLDLENLEVVHSLVLSKSHELLPRLHWVGILFGSIQADLAVTGGVHTPEDVLKCMMAGARVAMTTSCLLREGIERARQIVQGVAEWMEENEYESIGQMQGSMSYQHVKNAAAYERANYMKVLSSYVLQPR